MKIQCFMPVFNEADILPHTLRHLREQGVMSVHVIDGWSDDGSTAIAESFAFAGQGITTERFPASGPDPIQNCTAILKRIEDLAAASDADWILYSDADEWRRSFISTTTLAQAVAGIEAAGGNAIDFQVFQFYPTGDSWEAMRHWHSPESVFHYYDQADCISRIPNRKLWKNVGRVSLAGGGHMVEFPGMRVYPHKCVMKHYPFRTPQRARARIETRRARRCIEEHQRGWGVHYDQYPPDFDFCWRPEDLKFWRDTWTALP